MSAKNVFQTYYFVRSPRQPFGQEEEARKPILYSIRAKPHGDGIKADHMIYEMGYDTIIRNPVNRGISTNPEDALLWWRRSKQEMVANLRQQLELHEAELQLIPGDTSRIEKKECVAT